MSDNRPNYRYTNLDRGTVVFGELGEPGKRCGRCAWYKAQPFSEDICGKTGRIVGYLWERDCFTQKIETEMETKICKKCGRELPIDQFAKHVKSPDGHKYICMECSAAIQKEAQAKRHEKAAGEKIEMKVEKKVEAPVVEVPDVDLEREALDGVADAVEKNLRADLALWSDDALIGELKLRGYSGRITKAFEF